MTLFNADAAKIAGVRLLYSPSGNAAKDNLQDRIKPTWASGAPSLKKMLFVLVNSSVSHLTLPHPHL